MAVSKKKNSLPGVEFPLKSPRGTSDLLPSDQKYWEYVTENAKSFLRGWHFQQIETPIFEDINLFNRGIGTDTDIVQKELFEVKSRGKGTHYALRPEGTAAMVRSYIEHGMRSWPRPVKLFMFGPFFRYERPQAGRLRQFHQIDMEVIGSLAPITDVQVIYVLHLFFKHLGLEDFVVLINTLGEPAERGAYISLLKDHFKRNRQKLCRDCKERLTTNPLRLLDCKEEKCQQVGNTAPRLLDHLSESSKKHFEFTLQSLQELGVPHEVTPSLVRGLDYYTHTVFEFVPKSTRGESQQNTLAAGGRYNNLVKELGGKDAPAIGAAIGIERVIERVKAEGIELTLVDQPQLFIAQLGEQAKIIGLQVMKELRDADIPFAESIDRDGMQPQLRMADRLKVQWTIIIGQKEVLDQTVILRNMESGMQEVIDRDKLVKELERRLNIVRQ
ncbi:MAG TPA: histidine--tRNA ligase [Candidatus Andersenbacteria bacterium]|nr:histidine--tRNA ligase [Candidatus Andersenbacteria bacterium]